METAVEQSAPTLTWLELLDEIRELEAAGLVAVSIGEDAELRVELTTSGYACLRSDPA